jgi:hypothetical protein
LLKLAAVGYQRGSYTGILSGEVQKMSINQPQKNPTMLTASILVARIAPAGSSQRGRGNPFRKGDKSPLPLVAFLYLSFSAAFGRVYSVMAGCLGSLRAGRTLSRYFHPTQPVAYAVESISGGYSTLERELPHA